MAHETNCPESVSQKKKVKSLAWVITLVVIIGVVVALVFGLKGKLPGGDEKGNDMLEIDATNGVVSTPVGKLTFPEEWADAVQMEDTSTGDQYAVSFYGMIGADRIFLFEFSIGANGSGYQLGSVPDADGNAQMIWLNISAIQSDPSWSEEDITRINTMQGCVNDLMEQLRAMDGFQESN